MMKLITKPYLLIKEALAICTRAEKKYKLQAQIRRVHEKRLILALLRHGSMSRTDMASKLDVSLTSVSALSERLLRSGWIIWSGASNTGDVGRPAERLALRSEALCLPVISARRGTLSIALYSLTLEIIQSASFPYPEMFAHPGRMPQFFGFPVVEAEQFAAFVAQSLLSMSSYDASRAPTAVLSMPGNFVPPEPYFASAPLDFAIKGDFVTELKRCLALSVTLGNDADFLAFAQKEIGDSDSFIFININEGVGAGIIHHGHIFKSGRNNAAEIGHQSIDINGIECRCGGRGCLERYISFSAIAEQASMRLGRQVGIAEVFDACGAGETAILKLLEDTTAKLAFAISNMLAIFDSERVIIGGGVERFGEPFLASLTRRMREPPVRCIARQTPVGYVRSSHVDDRLGAASYYLEEIWSVPQEQESEHGEA